MVDHFGEAESFEELAMPEFARIYNFALWLTQDRAAAENLVQETYAKAQKGLSTYQPGSNFRAWLYRILRHTFMTTQAGLRAASNVMVQGEGAAEMVNGQVTGPLLLAQIDEDRLRESLEELPLSLREVVLLCDLEEMTYKEMSRILGIPPGSILARLNRARSLLRTLLTAPRPVKTVQFPVEEIPEMAEEEAVVEEDYSEEDEGEEPE